MDNTYPDLWMWADWVCQYSVLHTGSKFVDVLCAFRFWFFKVLILIGITIGAFFIKGDAGSQFGTGNLKFMLHLLSVQFFGCNCFFFLLRPVPAKNRPLGWRAVATLKLKIRNDNCVFFTRESFSVGFCSRYCSFLPRVSFAIKCCNFLAVQDSQWKLFITQESLSVWLWALPFFKKLYLLSMQCFSCFP